MFNTVPLTMEVEVEGDGVIIRVPKISSARDPKQALLNIRLRIAAERGDSVNVVPEIQGDSIILRFPKETE